jgi:hypothetical protein
LDTKEQLPFTRGQALPQAVVDNFIAALEWCAQSLPTA